jgi:hypothetical protein
VAGRNDQQKIRVFGHEFPEHPEQDLFFPLMGAAGYPNKPVRLNSHSLHRLEPAAAIPRLYRVEFQVPEGKHLARRNPDGLVARLIRRGLSENKIERGEYGPNERSPSKKPCK